MIKIVFVITSLSGGGAERVFAHILKNIDKSKFDIILAIGKKEGQFLDTVPSDIEIIELAGSKKASKSFFKLLSLLKDEKPDIVFSTLGMVSTSALCSLFLPSDIRFIARLGNTISADLDRVKKESYLKYLAQSIYYNVVIRTAEIVTQSQYMKNDLIAIYPFAKNRHIHQIYNPVEFYEKKEIQDIGNEIIQIITVGRFSWQKGYDYLLKAFHKVLQKNSNIKLTFIGTGILEDEMKSLAKELKISKNVEFAGHQNNPFEYIQNPDIFVSSSRFEGFSNVIIESLAHGIPVIATDCPSGNREVLTQGQNGWLSSMEGNIIDNLVDAICIAITDYKSLNMKDEKNKIMDKLNIHTIVEQYEDLFLGLSK
jgi:glycosyltransferase involved in cell wall biosynthesis